MIEDRQRLVKAASYKIEDKNEFGDACYASFVRVMIYRKDIALELLKSNDEHQIKYLTECYEYCNKQIKHILGL